MTLIMSCIFFLFTLSFNNCFADLTGQIALPRINKKENNLTPPPTYSSLSHLDDNITEIVISEEQNNVPLLRMTNTSEGMKNNKIQMDDTWLMLRYKLLVYKDPICLEQSISFYECKINYDTCFLLTEVLASLKALISDLPKMCFSRSDRKVVFSKLI